MFKVIGFFVTGVTITLGEQIVCWSAHMQLGSFFPERFFRQALQNEPATN